MWTITSPAIALSDSSNLIKSRTTSQNYPGAKSDTIVSRGQSGRVSKHCLKQIKFNFINSEFDWKQKKINNYLQRS